MYCPFCNSADTEVYNSRQSGAFRIWRRRRCTNCKESFTTYEQIDISFLTVVDANNNVSPYQRYILYKSINGAIGIIKQRTEAVDALTETIETKVLTLRQKEIKTSQIIEVALFTLRAFNLSSYLRYMANHTDIENIRALKQKISSN